jgi:4-oxalomesaconate hydratase
MTQQLRILSIGAHPADTFDQNAGTLAHHTSRGDYVACISLTNGTRVHDERISDSMFHREQVPDGPELLEMMSQRTGIKEQEVKAACDILGVQDVYFMGLDDAILLVNEDAIRKLARMIRQIKPDIIMTHFPKESDGLYSQHAVAGQIAMHAVQFAVSVDPGDRNPPHRVAQVFFFGIGAAKVRRGVWESEGGYTNDVFIDISDVVAKKLAALDCLVSQGYGGAYARKRIEASDGAFGQMANCPYAEGFITLKSETHYYLPLTEHELFIAASSDHEIMRHDSQRHQEG